MGDEGHISELIARMKNIRTLNDLKVHPLRKVNDLYKEQEYKPGGNPLHEADASGEENPEKIKISVRRRRYHDRRIGMFFSLVAAIIILSAIVIAIFLGFIE